MTMDGEAASQNVDQEPVASSVVYARSANTSITVIPLHKPLYHCTNRYTIALTVIPLH